MKHGTGFDRVLHSAQEFFDGVDRAMRTPYNAGDCKDAYNRLSRLRDRYSRRKTRRHWSRTNSLP